MIIELCCSVCGSTELGDCAYMGNEYDTGEAKLTILVPPCRCQIYEPNGKEEEKKE